MLLRDASRLKAEMRFVNTQALHCDLQCHYILLSPEEMEPAISVGRELLWVAESPWGYKVSFTE